MNWYSCAANQLSFDFEEENFFSNLMSMGFKQLGPDRYSLKVGNSVISGEPDSLIANLNYIIDSIKKDSNFIYQLVESIIDIDTDLRKKESMKLSPQEKEEYQAKILASIKWLRNSNLSNKNKIAIRDKIEDIANTFLINPTWVMMKLQTLNIELNNYFIKINAQINRLSEKRDLLIDGVQRKYLKKYYSHGLGQKTHGYKVESTGGGVFSVIKPDGKSYMVDMNSRKCSCPAGQKGVPCKHLALIDSMEVVR